MIATTVGTCRDCGEPTAVKNCTGEVSAVAHSCAEQEKRFAALIAESHQRVSEPWTMAVERIMKRAKAQGISETTILANALYEAMRRIEALEAKAKALDRRTIGSMRIGGART